MLLAARVMSIPMAQVDNGHVLSLSILQAWRERGLLLVMSIDNAHASLSGGVRLGFSAADVN